MAYVRPASGTQLHYLCIHQNWFVTDGGENLEKRNVASVEEIVETKQSRVE